eukprot:Rmarinus@m.19108
MAFVKIDGSKTVPLVEGRDKLAADTLSQCGLSAENPGCYPVLGTNDTPQVERLDPTTGKCIAKMQNATWDQVDATLSNARSIQKKWAALSSSKRVEIVMEMNAALSAKVEELGRLETLEVGKIPTESRGELIEVFDVADVIKARSGELGGDRPYYCRDYESGDPKRRALGWKGQCRELPIGVLGKMTAFNFPYAVFGWGALPALCAGNAVTLKPHPAASLTSFAMVKIMADVASKHGFDGLVSVTVMSDFDHTQKLWSDERIDMWEVTGSVMMGQAFMKFVGPSFRRTVLELGGNNAVIVHKDADPAQAVESCLFGCSGTAGQRCTTTRVMYVHDALYDKFIADLKEGYLTKLRIGDPLADGVNVGPVHHTRQVEQYKKAIDMYKKAGSELIVGGKVIDGNFVEPTVFAAPAVGYEAIKEEQFVPIAHVLRYTDAEVDKVLAEINGTGYGLSGGIFTGDNEFFEKCVTTIRVGILNQNYGSSGAEAGENFGGEGKTGNARMMGPMLFTRYTRPINSMRAPCGGEVVHAQGVEVK